MKKLLAETHKKVEKEYKPIEEIGKAIIEASVHCRDAVKELIHMPTEKERQEREIFIFYEFIYFYLHLTMRQTFGNLKEEQIKKVQDYLGPLISSVAIDSYFAHWPEGLKQKMTNEFYEKLNDAEAEYTECTQITPPPAGEERSKQIFRALFFKLSSNVANLAVDEENPSLLMPIMEVAVKEWTKMRLSELISEIKAAN